MQSKVGLVNISLPITITNSWTTTLQIGDIEASFILASYATPNGNNPVAFSNNLFVWLSTNLGSGVPWGQTAIANAAAASQGTAINGNYSASSYVVGYSCGPSVTSGGTTTYPNISATAEIPADWNLNNALYVSPSLGIVTAQTTFISFHYSLPQGFNPSANASWIGFWNGYVTPYNNQPATAAPITQSSNSGNAPMTGLGLTPHGQYTAALFTSGYSANPASLNLTTVATIIQFTTGASLA